MNQKHKFIQNCKDVIRSSIWVECVSEIQNLFNRYECNNYSLFETLLYLELHIVLHTHQNAFTSKNISNILIDELEWCKKEWNRNIDKLKEQSPPTLYTKET